jgi:hypothetical protein
MQLSKKTSKSQKLRIPDKQLIYYGSSGPGNRLGTNTVRALLPCKGRTLVPLFVYVGFSDEAAELVLMVRYGSLIALTVGIAHHDIQITP